MVGRSTASLTSLPTKIKISMNALRIAVLCAFALSVAVTTLSIIRTQTITCEIDGHQSHELRLLHITHVILLLLTFILLALYLIKSADIASLAAYREMRLRLTVDDSAGFIEHVPKGSPILNVCVGALAKKGIFVKSEHALTSLSMLKSLAVSGNSESREGYVKTKTTLADMGIELIETDESCPLKLALMPYMPETAHNYDFIFTGDKITHVLAAVHISRVYAKYTKYSILLFFCTIAAVSALLIFGQYTYAGAIIAFRAASWVLIVRRIERKTGRLTFQAISRYK